MSIKYLNLSGLEDLWINIKNYILSKIPTKTSELTNDSGYLTSHQSLDNYVTLNSNQTITAIKTITGGNQGKMLFKNPNYTKGDAVESGTVVSRLYFGNGTSYGAANGILTFDITSSGNTSLELCAMENTANSSVRASLILTYDKSATRPRMLKSWGDFIPFSNNNYTLGNTSNIWKECYCNAYYLGSTAFGDIVTHNSSEYAASSHTHTKSQITDFPTLATVATSGSYTDLSNKPTIPTVNNAILTIQKNGTTVKTFTANASSNVTCNITVPTKTSDLTNDSSFLTSHQAVSNSAPTLAWGTTSTIGTVGGTALTVKMPANPNTNTTYSAGTGLSLSGTTFSVTSTAGTSTLAWNSEVTLGTVGGLAIKAKLPANPNTDTKVTQTVTTGNSVYPVLLCATANATTTGTTTSRFSAGLTVNTRYSSIYITNKYDTANTKGVRNTSSYNNGILYFRSYDDTQMGLIRCDSHKSGYQHIYMQASNYIKDGAINPEGTATTCSIAVRVRDNGSKTIYTEGSWENSLTPYTNETYNLGTSSLKWLNCYCKNFYGSYVDIAGKYIGNEASTNGRTCLYLKANRDTDGKSGIYVTKFRQNRAQGSLSGSDIMYLSYDILENEVRTNGALIQNYGDWSNSVPGTLTLYSGIGTRNLGSSSYPWTNAYIKNLNLNGNVFDPTSIDGVGTVKLLAYLPTSSQEYTMDAGTIKAGSNLGEVWAFHASSDSVAHLNSNMSTTQSGTWKLLNFVSVGGNPVGCKVIGLWVRIA